MIIGITGSSGSGKSTVCEILESKYEFKIINADKIAKRLSQKGTDYLSDIVRIFGTGILLEDGKLDRPRLAEIIYSDSEKREKLNEFTFKYIREEIQKEIKIEEDIYQNIKEKIKNKNNFECTINVCKPLIAIDAPLLFEAKLEEFCDFVIAVISESKELQIKRIMQRDFIGQEQAVARLNAQEKDEYYTCKSDYVIINNGNLEKIERQIEDILEKI